MLDFNKVQTSITAIEQALADDDMPAISTQLMLVQRELQATPYLVDLLKPLDLGVLVRAERARMTEDILAQTAPKKRAPAKTKKLSMQELLDNTNTPDDF